MRTFINDILNEARVQRTIDPKIWASMSSMSSRLRSTLGENAKVMKKDTKEVLLQKYVAGLLTMKVGCPHNNADINKLKHIRILVMHIQMQVVIQQIFRNYMLKMVVNSMVIFLRMNLYRLLIILIMMMYKQMIIQQKMNQIFRINRQFHMGLMIV